ncbi:MAG: TIGR03668 family PPOX class F420-dependent oxidoreductase [Actinomycetota bacterium]|nr:TIGR03668 family PPOX class F420-dependent oxidoreductase [Actinomycetota bacterium]
MRLSEQECRARFTQALVARLATVAEDGSPRIVPITFAGPAGQHPLVVFFSAVDSKPKSTTALARLARIGREPRVSLLVDEYDADWSELWWVRGDALADVLTAGSERDSAIALLREKYAQYRAEPPTGAVLRFVVQRWSGWSASEAGASSGT